MGEREWSELFALLFEEIADRLFCMEDLFSFRMVCRSCRHFIRFEKHYYQPLLSKGIPWLMLTHRETNVNDNDNDNDSDHEGEINEHHDDDSTRNFFSLSTNKSYSLYLPEACGRRCWGSRYGWLITLGIDLEIHLLNPITRAGLPLPPQSTFKPRDPFHWPPSELRRHFVSKAVLGLLPSSSSFYEDQFIVFMLYLCGRLAFARPGDNAWTAIKTPSFIDVTFFNGQIFGIHKNLCKPVVISIFICDIYRSHRPTLLVHGPVGKSEVNNYYLVEIAGELHFVTRGYSYEEGNKKCHECESFKQSWECEHMQPGGSQHMPTTDHFVVYKLDLCTKEFTDLESFEDHALFVGTNSSFSISVAGHPGFKGNCIYFTDDHDAVKRYIKFRRDMGIFDYKDKMVKPFYFGPDTLSEYCPPTLFTPNLW